MLSGEKNENIHESYHRACSLAWSLATLGDPITPRCLSFCLLKTGSSVWWELGCFQPQHIVLQSTQPLEGSSSVTLLLQLFGTVSYGYNDS